MQGENTITDNTGKGVTDNVYLSKNVVITVTGSLEGSSIGITMQNVEQGAFTSGYSTYNKDVKPQDCFKSDNDEYGVLLHENECILEADENDIATGVELNVTNGEEEVYYTINGVKLDGKPTEKGIYIVNGKKVFIK